MTAGFDSQSIDAARPLGGQNEMRLATVMMVDIVGSTEIGEQLGPESSYLLLTDVLESIKTVISAHGGTVVNEMGDGLVALFGAPTSIERASLAACRASLEMCAAVQTKEQPWLSRFGVSPKIRVGVASGEILLTGLDGNTTLNVTGKQVSLAERLQSLAAPNGVVASQDVVAETQGWADFAEIGSHKLKGFKTPVAVFALQQVMDSLLTSDTPAALHGADFVGRAEQLAEITKWYQEDRAALPVALVIGEAGIGKSRILAEFLARLDGVELVLGSCHPTTMARPLAPLIEVLRGFAGWHDHLPQAEIETKFSAAVSGNPEHSRVLAKLIGRARDATQTADRRDAAVLRQAMVHALLWLGRERDILLAIEDLHWVDPLTADILLEVVAQAPDGFRIIGTTRPAPWLDDLPSAQILMVQTGPLAAADIGAIGVSVLGKKAETAVIERITKTSEGNPFFAIEMLHSFATHNDEVQAGRIGSIQNIALARFDQLAPSTKAQLRFAAFQGRSFRFDVLQTATQDDAFEGADLLQVSEGIIERDPRDPDQMGRFRHILFRDSIYATVPATTAKTMHLATAQAMEACGISDGAAVDQLAYHYEKAQEPVQACKYLRAAAQNAYWLYALDSCKAIMGRAFALMEANIDRFDRADIEEALLIHLRNCDVRDEFREVIAAAETWLPHIRTQDGNAGQAMILALTGKAHCHLGDVDFAHQRATEALELATRVRDEGAVAYAKVVLMRTLNDTDIGQVEDIERLYEETADYCERLPDATLYANRMFHMMAAYRSYGLFKKALAINAEIEAFAQQHDQPHIMLVSEWNRGLNMSVHQDFPAIVQLSKEGLQNAARNSAVWEIFKLLEVVFSFLQGQHMPLESLEKIYANADARGEFTTRNSAAVQIGFANLAAGRLRLGLQHLSKAQDELRKTGTHEALRSALLFHTEFLLVVAGLYPLTGTPPKLKPRDLLTGIGLRFRAKRQAKALLEELFGLIVRAEGFYFGRAHLFRALIALSDGDKQTAKDSFDIAERCLGAEDITQDFAIIAEKRAAAGL